MCSPPWPRLAVHCILHAAMSSRITVPLRLSPTGVVEWFPAWNAVANQPDLTIEGLDRAWIEPAGIAALAAGCAARSAAGLITRIAIADERSASIEALRSMEFFRVVGIEDESTAARGPTAGGSVPLRSILSEGIAEQTARACGELLRAHLPGLASSLRRYARNVIEELGVNILQHSGAPGTGFAMAQAWGGDAPRFQIAAADAGVGFLASLQRNLEFAGRIEEDGDALQLALTKGLTSTDGSNNSGFGLEMLRSLADVLGAELRIASGSALLIRRSIAGQRTTVIRSVGPWRGSWISLDAPLPKLPS